MIDLNCRVIDGTGGGPETYADSLEMCRAAAKEGVRALVAPLDIDPAREDDFSASFNLAQTKIDNLRRDLDEKLSLRAGCALRFHHSLPQFVERHGESATLGGGRCVFVHVPSLEIPAGAEDVWAALARSGHQVMLARPECSPALRHDSARLERWLSQGLMMQIDAMSLTRAYGRDVQRFAWRLAQKYCGQAVVASNARGALHQRPSLKIAREELTRQIGAWRAQLLLEDNPARIVKLDGASPSAAAQRHAAGAQPLGAFFRLLKPKKTFVNAP